MTDAVTVRLATLADLPYIEALRQREKRAIGFISLAGYEHVITRRGEYAYPNTRLWVALIGGERVGFLYGTPGQPGGSLKIVQVCLQRDARRRDYGTALVQTAEAWAVALQRPAVSCRVRVDLEARDFWEALGYPVTGEERGGKRFGVVTNDKAFERRYKPLPGGLLVPTAQGDAA